MSQKISHVRIIVEIIGQKRRHFVTVSEPHKCKQLFLPGGHVEPGQSVRAAALAELTEETGIVLPEDYPLRKFGSPMRGTNNKCVLYYWVQIHHSRIGSLKPCSGDEVREVKILLRHELKKMIKNHRRNLLKYINQVPVGTFLFCKENRL